MNSAFSKEDITKMREIARNALHEDACPKKGAEFQGNQNDQSCALSLETRASQRFFKKKKVERRVDKKRKQRIQSADEILNSGMRIFFYLVILSCVLLVTTVVLFFLL